MGKNCCTIDCVGSALKVYNIILFITSSAVLGIVTWILLKSYFYMSLLTSPSFPILLYALLASGILAAIVAVPIGCLANKKRSQILLLFYIFILLLVLLIQAMVGIMSYVYQESVEENLKLNLNETILTNYGIDEKITDSVDQVQEKFRCCGSEWVKDWQESYWYQTSDKLQKIPDSCCKTVQRGCGKISDGPSNINIAGCLYKILQSASDSLWLMSATGVGFCWFNIFGVIFGICLYLKLKDEDYKVEDPLISNNRH
ncbi:unnamed protein product [Brassicogethes aeneus]|uniref:Tetraspanin n=1 Tax=Brassicogethes aeneus TaxID=1431903 RepID=A0A9P0FLE3_BRAAE|nr:unnamed protein product [Brassicogethes aeneus]